MIEKSLLDILKNNIANITDEIDVAGNVERVRDVKSFQKHIRCCGDPLF